MRRTILTSAALALLLLLGGIAVAGAAPVPEAKGGDGGARALRFEVRFSPFQLIDVGDPGPGVGDYVVFHDQLLSGGKKVGDEGGSCPIVDAGEGLIHCTGTVRLAGGQIAFQGLTTSAPTKQLAVTGGTGRFQSIGGEATLVENGDGTGSLTLRLRR
jgi:hypothetical protein